MKCRPRKGFDIGPTPDRPSHSSARDKGLIHPTPHCVRRGAACFVVPFNAAAAREAPECPVPSASASVHLHLWARW